MQLLRITRVPMKYEFVTEPARLAYKTDRGGFTLQRQGGELNIDAQRAQIRQDSTQFFNSMGLRTSSAAKQYAVEQSLQDYRQAVVNYVDTGNQLINIQKGVTVPELARQRMMESVQAGNLTLTPLSPVNINWTPAQMSMNYRPVTLNFDWQTAKSSMEFIPGKFSMNIQQYPELKIEYLGRPIYVPASADPEYTGGA